MINKDKHMIKITGFKYDNAIFDIEGVLYEDMDNIQTFELTSIYATNNANLLEYLGFETVNNTERKAFNAIVEKVE